MAPTIPKNEVILTSCTCAHQPTNFNAAVAILIGKDSHPPSKVTCTCLSPFSKVCALFELEEKREVKIKI